MKTKCIISLLLSLFVFQGVDAQKQQDYEKLMAKALNEKQTYETERDSLSRLLRNKVGFFKQDNINKEFRNNWFSDKDVIAWKDSIRQAVSVLDKYSREYIYDLKNKYEKYPSRIIDEETEKTALEEKILELQKSFENRTENLRWQKLEIDKLNLFNFLQKYVIVGETFRADGTETYLRRNSSVQRKLPAGDYIITNNKKIVSAGRINDEWTIELKSKHNDKKYSLSTQWERYRNIGTTRIGKEYYNEFSSKFVDFQKKTQEINEQLDYSKSSEKQETTQVREEIEALQVKIDSIKLLPNPYQKEYEEIIDLAETLTKGKIALEAGVLLKNSQYNNLRKQQSESVDKARIAERERKRKELIATYGNEIGNKIYNNNYWVGMKEEYLKAGDYSTTLVHSDGNTRVYRYTDLEIVYNDIAFIYKYAIFKNGKLTSLTDSFIVKN